MTIALTFVTSTKIYVPEKSLDNKYLIFFNVITINLATPICPEAGFELDIFGLGSVNYWLAKHQTLFGSLILIVVYFISFILLLTNGIL